MQGPTKHDFKQEPKTELLLDGHKRGAKSEAFCLFVFGSSEGEDRLFIV